MKEIGMAGTNSNGARDYLEDAERVERAERSDGLEPPDRSDGTEPDGTQPDGAWMSRALHDLSQPLTALECLLYVNREPIEGESLDAGFLRSVMEAGLVECGRMMVLVRGMQDRMLVEEEVP